MIFRRVSHATLAGRGAGYAASLTSSHTAFLSLCAFVPFPSFFFVINKRTTRAEVALKLVGLELPAVQSVEVLPVPRGGYPNHQPDLLHRGISVRARLLSDDVYLQLGFARFLNWTAFSVMESADVFLKYASPHARIASSSQPAGHGATVSRAAPAFN